ncbi:hypothetical protein [Pleionea sp. CnH1-48]|uniref:hypothetical protein n=1 Tax=Pleionea sp. CnH1-48 TaxID=2954494 RepID=UPI002097AB2A|nr:hypothetical protein [Pleionea sp. CnH1-48]MCO7227539.1 hypothetical protein [Pleionea sp. CnH1-48]
MSNYKNILINSVIAVFIGFVTLVITSNKSLYENIFSSWLAQCRVSIETTLIKGTLKKLDNNDEYDNQIAAVILLHAYGSVPVETTIRFVSSNPIDNVKMLHVQGNNRLIHPQIKEECLWGEVDDDNATCISVLPELSPEVSWKLKNFSENMDVAFKVEFRFKGDSPAHLPKAYLVGDREMGKCLVEEASWHNFWTWAGKGWSITILLFILALLTSLTTFLKDVLSKRTSDKNIENS